ncbi:hypothetical protein [Mycolicibacterium sp.]|uniref:hypothetical protein n=1 Tax=Mycolicibacterium sp. TaxID=2320850 RepID=UPI0037C92B2C
MNPELIQGLRRLVAAWQREAANAHGAEAATLGTCAGELSDLIDMSLAAANPPDESHVYVLEVEITEGGDYAGWTSVHRTPEGARARLEDKVDEWGLREVYEAEGRDDLHANGNIAAGEEGDPLTYGISRLPVED